MLGALVASLLDGVFLEFIFGGGFESGFVLDFAAVFREVAVLRGCF